MARDFGGTKSNRSTSSSESNPDANVLGRGLRVRGRVNGASDLRVDGEIEGDVRVTGALEVGQTGTVSGNIAARSVVVDGALTGDVEAEGTVVIRSGARVSGNMNGAEVALEEGASFSGRIEAEFELPDDLMAGAGPGLETRAGRRNAHGTAARGR